MTIVVDKDATLESGEMWTNFDEADERLQQHLERLAHDGWTIEDVGATFRLTKDGEAARFVGIIRFYAISEKVVR